MIPINEETMVVITYNVIKIGVFISAFAAFYFLRMQRYEHYGYAFKSYGSPRDSAVKLFLLLIIYATMLTVVMYILVNSMSL